MELPDVFSAKVDDQSSYKMIMLNENYEIAISEECRTIGKVVILSFERFSPASIREGAHVDRNGLRYFFEEIGFHVEVYVDFVKAKVVKLVESIAKTEFQGMLIFVVMSHGEGGTKFITSDGEFLCLMDDIVKPLQKSEILKKKIKVYLANFCRELVTSSRSVTAVMNTNKLGTKSKSIVPCLSSRNIFENVIDELFPGQEHPHWLLGDEPTAVVNDHSRVEHSLDAQGLHDVSDIVTSVNISNSSVNSPLPDDTGTTAFKISDYPEDSRITSPADDTNGEIYLPDTLVTYSTVPGTISRRDDVRGSLFICTFLRIAVQMYKQWDLLQIISKTSDIMLNDEGINQYVHSNIFGLSRKVMLFPTMNTSILEWLQTAIAAYPLVRENALDAELDKSQLLTHLPYFVERLMFNDCTSFDLLLANCKDFTELEVHDLDTRRMMHMWECAVLSEVLRGEYQVKCFHGILHALKMYAYRMSEKSDAQLKTALSEYLFQTLDNLYSMYDDGLLMSSQLALIYKALIEILHTVPHFSALANDSTHSKHFAPLKPIFGDIFHRPFTNGVIQNPISPVAATMSPPATTIVPLLDAEKLFKYKQCFELGANMVILMAGELGLMRDPAIVEDAELKIQCACSILGITRSLFTVSTMASLLPQDQMRLCKFAYQVRYAAIGMHLKGGPGTSDNGPVDEGHFRSMDEVVTCIKQMREMPVLMAAFETPFLELVIRFVDEFGQRPSSASLARDLLLKAICVYMDETGSPIKNEM